MAKHRFDGTWTYFEMPHNGTPVPTEGRNLILAIPDEGGKVDEDNSSHGGVPVDGQASNKTLDLERTGGGNKRTLTGKVVFEKTVGSAEFIVIAGRFVDEDENNVRQNEGTWIVTKP